MAVSSADAKLGPRRVVRVRRAAIKKAWAIGQTSKPISATRPLAAALQRSSGTEKEKTNEMHDYLVFVAGLAGGYSAGS